MRSYPGSKKPSPMEPSERLRRPDIIWRPQPRSGMSTKTQIIRSTAAPLALTERVGRVFKYRELLVNLVRRELRARYKESALGFAWSMLNPVLYLVVFYLVFNIFLPGGIPYFPVYLLCGLLPWTLFSNSLTASAVSVVSGGPLLKKVYFPREILPLASLGAAMFHFLLQTLVLLGFLVIFRYPFVSANLVLVPVALAVETLLLIGLGLLLSAATVYLRDIQHFLDLATLALFWMTPIVYPVALVAGKLQPKGLFGLYLLNPVTPIVLSFQRAFYNQVAPTLHGQTVQILLDQPMSWYLGRLGLVGAASIVLIVVGQILFARLEGNFAAEL